MSPISGNYWVELGSNEDVRVLSGRDCVVPNSDKCVFIESHIEDVRDLSERDCEFVMPSGNYWVELGFINNCKDPQL